MVFDVLLRITKSITTVPGHPYLTCDFAYTVALDTNLVKAANTFCQCLSEIKVSTEYSCTVQSGPDYICSPLLFFLVRAQESQGLDGCQKRPGHHAAETFTSQAGRDTVSDRRKENGRKTSEPSLQLFSLLLPVSLLFVSVCLSFFSYSLLKPYCICPPSLAGGK